MLNRNVLLAGVVAIAGVGVNAAQASTVVVNVFSFDFSTNRPGEAIVDPTINVGDTVRWVFLDGFHSATSVSGIAPQFDSGILGSGRTFEYTFSDIGRFEYYCSPHGFDRGDGTAGGMAGVITVVPAPGVGMLLLLSGMAASRRRR